MAGKKKRISMNHWFYHLLKPVIRIWLEKQFNLEANIPEEVRNLKPPYLILPNHQGFWDPFMAGIYIKPQIFYIASDAVFRSPFFKFLMNLLGAIPKTKAQSDLDALKSVIRVKDRGEVIGIFPEGRRTWDGVTLPLVYSTSKLIRMLKVPVVRVVFKGGFFSQPRWGFHIQRGKVLMDYKILFSGIDLKTMKVDEIHRRLADALYFDEIEYQKKEAVEFRGKKPAEYLEQVLYTCPACKKIGTMYSKGDNFTCTECHYELNYNSLRIFESSKNEVIFNNIRDWNKWQQENLYTVLDNSSGSEAILIKDENLVFHTGYRSNKPKYLTSGSLSLNREDLIIKESTGRVVNSFPLDQITGLNVQNKERLEFYHESTMYTIRGKFKRFSAYKWLKAMEYLFKDRTSQFQAGIVED